MKLFAVVLGGRAPRCNTELHDVVFAVAHSFEETHPTLIRQWFGDPRQVHIDAWVELSTVDGHRVELKSIAPPQGAPRLFYVNMGAYLPGRFAEQHEEVFLVAADAEQAKARAKRESCHGMDQIHKDTMHLVDDCLEVSVVGGLHVHLIPDLRAPKPKVTCAYRVFSKEVVEGAFLR